MAVRRREATLPPLPANLDVLRQRDFRLLLGAQGVSMFGDRMVAIALAFAVLELDGTPTEVGIVLAARTLPLVACLLLGGVVADGEIGGPLLAGVLVAAVGPGWALAVDAATFAASAGFLVRLPVPARAEREATTFLADLREGWDTFRSYTWVWTFVAWAALGNLLWGAWQVLGPVVADRELGGAAAWGAILAALGVGALIGAVAAIRGALRRPMLAVAWTAFAGVPPLALLAIGAPAALVAAGAMIIGFGMMFGNTVWEATLQRMIPLDSLSRVSAYDWFGSIAFQPVGAAIWGPVAGLIGIESALWLAATLVTLSGAALLAVPDIRRLESVPAR